MNIKTKYYCLSPNDNLPDKIKDPEELIKKIIRRIKINSIASNINSTFQWVKLAEKILKRYSYMDNALIMELNFNLADVLLDKSDYEKARKYIKKAIIICCRQNKIKKNKLSEYYWYMAQILRRLCDYKNAEKYILKAMEYKKKYYNYHSEYAKILYKLNKNKEADENYKKAIEYCIRKKGKTHPATGAIFSNYGICLYETGNFDLALKYFNKANKILKYSLGKDNLYTIRNLGHISNTLFIKKQYSEAFENMRFAFNETKRILGDNDKETLVCKTNCSKILIKMKKYNYAMAFLDNPFIITDNEDKFILLAYNKINMTAPELLIYKTGSSAVNLLKMMNRKNIPIVKNIPLVNGIIRDCNQFEPIKKEYWESVGKILSKIIKENT